MFQALAVGQGLSRGSVSGFNASEPYFGVGASHPLVATPFLEIVESLETRHLDGCTWVVVD